MSSILFIFFKSENNFLYFSYFFGFDLLLFCHFLKVNTGVFENSFFTIIIDIYLQKNN